MAQDARAYLRETLRQFGLESLVDWAFGRLNEGTSEAQILLDLRQQPVYKQRFPAMEALSKKNRAFSEAEYVAYEKQTAGLMNMYGLPAGFYDSPDDFAQLIEKEVSVNELQSRIAVAAEASQKASSEIKAQLKRFYDVSEGDITAYFLDPTIAAPLLEQRFTAAKIGAASRTSRFGDVTSQEAEQVASLAPQDYQEKLSKFSEEQELYTGTPRESDALTRSQQLQTAFGSNEQGRAEIEKRRATRQAEFKGKSQYAQGQGSAVSGIGASE